MTKWRFNYIPNGPQDLFEKVEEKNMVLTGNEAYARGLYESNCQFLSMYPGTPISEIGDLWETYSLSSPDIYYDLSINEAVAFEAAVGAAWSGIRSAFCCKHLGINIISDALHSIMYAGIHGKQKAGMIIICGTDPNIKSSTNAQDIRLFSLHSKLPILSPSTTQECKDFIQIAFKLSEELSLPVMIYSPSELNHSSGLVNLSPVKTKVPKIKTKDQIHFLKNRKKFLNAIHWALKNQAELNEKIGQLQSDIKYQKFIQIEGKNQTTLSLKPIDTKKTRNSTDNTNRTKNNKDLSTLIPIRAGIICEGISWTYCKEIINKINKDLPRMRIQLIFPLNKQIIKDFVQQNQIQLLIIIEEQEKFIELMIKDILYDFGICVKILGKNIFPIVGGMSTDIVLQNLSKEIQINGSIYKIQEFSNNTKNIQLMPKIAEIQTDLPIREPTFCPGCSHRNVFYSLKKASEEYYRNSGKEPIYGGDIGCYTMSMSTPYETMDWLICMGAGVGISNGIAQVFDSNSQHIIAMIGDSTLFHTGIQPVINLAKNNANVLVLILDNFYSAMTGHQYSPSTPQELIKGNTNEEGSHIDIKNLIQTMGNFPIKVLDGYNVKNMQLVFSKLYDQPGLKFAIVKAECALNRKRRYKKDKSHLKNQKIPFSETKVQILDHCTKCNECFERLGCTAIQNFENHYTIDQSRCIGEFCLSCTQICPNHAIYKTVIHPTEKTISNIPIKEIQKIKENQENQENQEAKNAEDNGGRV